MKRYPLRESLSASVRLLRIDVTHLREVPYGGPPASSLRKCSPKGTTDGRRALILLGINVVRYATISYDPHRRASISTSVVGPGPTDAETIRNGEDFSCAKNSGGSRQETRNFRFHCGLKVKNETAEGVDLVGTGLEKSPASSKVTISSRRRQSLFSTTLGISGRIWRSRRCPLLGSRKPLAHTYGFSPLLQPLQPEGSRL